jgi:D-amino-acid dehydrogenase
MQAGSLRGRYLGTFAMLCEAPAAWRRAADRGAIQIRGQALVDPRRLHGALRARATALGCAFVRGEVIAFDGGKSWSVQLDAGSSLTAEAVVIAAGAWSGSVADRF